MKQRPTKLMAYAIMTGLIGLSAGCVSTQEVETLKQQLETVESTANQANTKAESAQSDAAAAMEAAEESKTMAEESQACCRANSEKLNRMFDQVQQK